MGNSWRVGLAAGLVLAAPALGLAGCAGSEDQADTAVERSVPAGDAATAGAAADAAGAGETAAGGAADAAVVVAAREIVSTASMTVVTKDVTGASADAEAAVTARGGFVFGQQDGGAEGSAVLTLKVPSAEFRPLLVDLGELGDVESREVTTEDVSAQGVDLDARIVSAQRSVERVRAFLDEAKNVGELASVEGELTRRETELEQLQGQRRVLTGRVSLATVTLTISGTPAPAPPEEDGWRSVPGFGGALASALGALVKVGRLTAAAAGYVLPFAVVFAVPVVVGRRLTRRRRDAAVAPIHAEGDA